MKKLEVAYFAASCDEEKLNQEFAEELKLDFPLLSDPGKKIGEAYGVVDAAQKFPRRWTFYIGKDGKILHVDKGVKTDSHGSDIVAKLKELGVAERK